MQLRFTPPLVTTVATSGFRQGISSILSGLTVAGAFSTVIFSSNLASEKVSESLDKFIQGLKASLLYDGIAQVATTLKDWGSAVVGAKDDLKSWVERYLGADGLKSGVATLYEKLHVWANIVYDWFANKFLKFISNISEMVKNWKQLRLSLFKWGTFLGGGGGSALWVMFGSGENWDKLGELLGNPEFADIAEKFSKLVEDNGEAFASMDKEEAQEILEQFLENPEVAKEITEELLEDQKEKNKEKKEDEKKDELSKDEIKEAFSKGGSPKDPQGVFQNMLGGGIQSLVDLSNSFFGGSLENTAKKAMQDYVDHLKKEVSKGEVKSKADKAKQEFLKALEEDKEGQLIKALTDSTVKAYKRVELRGKVTFEELSKELGSILESDYTEECRDNCEGEGVSLKDKVPNFAPKMKKRK
ncbi:hypothetical protein A6V39_00815 [Candidatus Mycoplasma haematobovis]|uniref:Uncharacterized protein n=1 Tax=Candidatus Mycoplasma haematobovis TaxID=432608 RepID=A0A1A9QDP9_9MOLU|nr:hypothetical protein [Candidatus Mycoplasma haematobovis]OAL10593.1 hypothetical protein A6V39_00815 [Candidatus Mycoplasma haematobovis]